MKKEELAQLLNGTEYGRGRLLSKVFLAQANGELSGLVVVYGASDDLMEFEGAIDDEYGCYGGGEVRVDKHGLLPSWESVRDEDSEDEVERYFNRKRHARLIKAVWDDGDGYSWTYETSVPHATFAIVEDGEKYCRGIVFSLEDL